MGGETGQEAVHTHHHRTQPLGQASGGRHQDHRRPRAEHRLHTQALGQAKRQEGVEAREGVHRVLAARHSHRPGPHAGGADAHVHGAGHRLLLPERRHVPPHEKAHLPGHGLHHHTDRVHRRAGHEGWRGRPGEGHHRTGDARRDRLRRG